VVPTTPAPTATPTPTPARFVAGAALPRTLQNLDLHAAHAEVPLHVTAPSIGVDTVVVGVGLTTSNNVDAPEGARTSPLWDDAFWYRGSAEPGQPGVFALAGHVDRVGGAPAAFARLAQVKPGDVVTVSDRRSGVDYRYRITEARAYSLKDVSQLPVLERIYGPEVARGQPALVPADGVARISVITCTGSWTGSQYDHRFVAFGELVSPLP
jgi:sortase (surface protein transpeptidase)